MNLKFFGFRSSSFILHPFFMPQWAEIYEFISGKVEAFRRRIDVDDENREHEFALEARRAIEQSRAERALQRIAQTVDSVLADEIIRTPSGKAFVPEHFIVFLNPQDERDWQGAKREFIRRELAEIIMTEARRRAGEHALTTDNLEIEFRVDATLDDDEMRVSAVYGDKQELTFFTNNEKTEVFGREDLPGASGEKTETNFQTESLFAVDVWENGKHQNTIQIYKPMAVVGRGTSSFPVDVPLRKAAVSRRHAVVEFENDEFFITHIGANPTILDDQELPPNAKTRFDTQQKIKICDFELQVRPTAQTSPE